MSASMPWSRDFFYNFSERALLGFHPVKTLRAYLAGSKIHAVGEFARSSGLDQDPDYCTIVMAHGEPHAEYEKPFDIIGRAYYDRWHDETVIAVTARRIVVPRGERPYPKHERKTFAIPGNHIPQK